MKARVIGLSKDGKYMNIDLIDNNNKVCLCTQISIYVDSYIKILFYSADATTAEHYLSICNESKKAKRILVKNIGKIINKVFSIFVDYDESDVESIKFDDSCVAYVMLKK